MKYRRLNITLPKALLEEVGKVTTNKSAFIARAVADRLAKIEDRPKKEERRRELLEAYRYAAKHPECENDGRADW